MPQPARLMFGGVFSTIGFNCYAPQLAKVATGILCWPNILLLRYLA